jgi:hypothetical protein
MNTRNFEQFTKISYSGVELLKKHSLSEYGIWRVRGEDPNCDWGGSHHQPDLGSYEGKLQDVIRVAVELPGFWQWGAGGDITRTNIEKVDSSTIAERNKKRARLKEVEAEQAQLRKDLSLD